VDTAAYASADSLPVLTPVLIPDAEQDGPPGEQPAVLLPEQHALQEPDGLQGEWFQVLLPEQHALQGLDGLPDELFRVLLEQHALQEPDGLQGEWFRVSSRDGPLFRDELRLDVLPPRDELRGWLRVPRRRCGSVPLRC
jgi:hypothetical protein